MCRRGSYSLDSCYNIVQGDLYGRSLYSANRGWANITLQNYARSVVWLTFGEELKLM